MSAFEALGLSAPLLQATADMGFEKPTEVQAKAIPLLLESETDLVALAQTGTGKTAAFGFPLIQKINVKSRNTQGLIIAPTRELCLQITHELRSYSQHVKGLHIVAVYGGASVQGQAKDLKNGAQIIVATPGRMKDLIGRGVAVIKNVEYCVLDEADEMLNMGFYEDIKEILSHTPEDKSTWLFSATMPKEVAAIAKKFMYDPQEITVGNKNSGAQRVDHEYYLISARDRYLALKRLADANPNIFSVVFCRTKRDTQKVAEMLIEDGYNAAALHGDLSQNQRDLVMKSFRTKQIQMLVATDVAARGIDVDDITHVINYQLPDEIETYTHRSGRTGRAGKSGISMVLVSKSEIRKIKAIEKIIQKEFKAKSLPTGMEICEIQLLHLAEKIEQTDVNLDIEPYVPAIMESLGKFDQETLIKKIFSVEFSRFFNYYKNAKELNVPEVGNVSAGGNSTRFFINVGAKDDFSWMTLKDFLKDLLQIKDDGLFKVDVKGSFSFFNVEEPHVKRVLETFEDFTLDGRRIVVEATTEKRRKGGGKRFKDSNSRGKQPRTRKSDKRRGGKFNDDFSNKRGRKNRSGNKPKGTGGKRRRR
ncbi:DEAD/DEAH box helicase [Gilvibacter sp.]|uniref:DEAD/DEAH box helicase n=1 Tax=Gilvibacter sp. TaxID=2729997 RepID=UPI003F49C1C1